jgi:hypothetical protein
MLYDNSRDCAVEFPFDELDKPPGDGEPLVFSLADMLESMRRITRYIRTKDRTRLTVDCMFLALGDEDAESETMTSVAEKHGVTKAAVSKRTKEIRVQLHLSINANNKSSRAIAKYRDNHSPLRIEGTA